jgi:hypothetical protein
VSEILDIEEINDICFYLGASMIHYKISKHWFNLLKDAHGWPYPKFSLQS